MCVCVSIAAPSVRCIINAKRAEGGGGISVCVLHVLK